MKCMFCGSEMQLRQEHCPRCGKKAIVDFDVLKDSVHEDAAIRRTQAIEAYVRWAVLAMLIIGAFIYGINMLFDKPLIYDGALIPALPVAGEVPVVVPSIEKPYTDPRKVPQIPPGKQNAFGYRQPEIRDKLRSANKGDAVPEKMKSLKTAIGDALAFLAGNQNSDGCWRVVILPREWPQYDTKEYDWGTVGVTGLALSAFLGEGELPWDPDEPNKITTYGKNIFNAVRFLLLAQDEKTGRFGPGQGQGVKFMYNHGMATIAMCEVAGMTGDYNLKLAAQHAVDYIVKTQTAAGGWNYYGNPEGDNDTSVTAWQVQALVAGREAGLNIPQGTFDKSLELYKKATTADNFVKYSLEKNDPLDPQRITLCGVALMMRNILGDDPRSPSMRRLAEKLSQNLPEAKPNWGGGWRPNLPKNDDVARGRFDPYLIYFGTYGLFYSGGRDWQVWHEGPNKERTGQVEGVKRALLTMQAQDGSWKTNDQPNSYAGGTNYSTALCVMALQVYYRFQ